jgi:hypothetical protein
MKPSLMLSALVLFAAMLACAGPLPSFPSGFATQPQSATEALTAASNPTATNPPAATVTPTATRHPLPQGMPDVETDPDAMLATLQSGEAGYFEAFAVEKYSDKDFAQPGTVTFTVAIPADQKIFFNYGWCAENKDTLKQNLEHIDLKMFFNGEEIPGEYILPLSSAQDNGWECAHGGMLLSGWKPGKYDFRIVATFDQKINDGSVDYDAGDYILEYDVTVK